MAWHVEMFVVAAAAVTHRPEVWFELLGPFCLAVNGLKPSWLKQLEISIVEFCIKNKLQTRIRNETNIMTAHSSCVGSLFNQKACTIPDGMFTWINTEHEKLCKCGAIISTGSTNSSISFPSFLTKRCEFKSIHTGTQLSYHACSACCWMK